MGNPAPWLSERHSRCCRATLIRVTILVSPLNVARPDAQRGSKPFLAFLGQAELEFLGLRQPVRGAILGRTVRQPSIPVWQIAGQRWNVASALCLCTRFSPMPPPAGPGSSRPGCKTRCTRPGRGTTPGTPGSGAQWIMETNTKATICHGSSCLTPKAMILMPLHGNRRSIRLRSGIRTSMPWTCSRDNLRRRKTLP
jgi:hypothetical protein